MPSSLNLPTNDEFIRLPSISESISNLNGANIFKEENRTLKEENQNLKAYNETFHADNIKLRKRERLFNLQVSNMGATCRRLKSENQTLRKEKLGLQTSNQMLHEKNQELWKAYQNLNAEYMSVEQSQRNGTKNH
jgi:hypothetical protein